MYSAATPDQPRLEVTATIEQMGKRGAAFLFDGRRHLASR